MARDIVTVRLRHQIPGYSVGEVVGYPRAVANRLVEEKYAEYYVSESEKESTTTSDDADEETKEGARARLSKQMATRGSGSPYLTK